MEMGHWREREERATVTKQREEGKGVKNAKMEPKEESKSTGLSESCREKGRMKERETERR